MTKLDIVNQVSEITGLSKVETELTFEAIINSIKVSLSKGERVDIRGLGSFAVKEKSPRQARNPATNEVINLDKRFVPFFKVSKLLKEYVDKSMKSI
ncbi:MAG: integration host factor subunit beta [Candidatus Marinimicrobia bacterium]|nr:integration host factor subunit beta [Candidatus Neomarinimicrobiota bacterium]|tara:strand:- start:5811 stop:6101 length:291 start_codon:yes stop_codon:yes gene_type:complete